MEGPVHGHPTKDQYEHHIKFHTGHTVDLINSNAVVLSDAVPMSALGVIANAYVFRDPDGKKRAVLVPFGFGWPAEDQDKE